MEIVVNDTNVLIDLFNAGLLPYCRRLSLEFRTLDVIMDEIKSPEQRKSILRLVDDGTLAVHSLSASQIGAVSNRYSDYQSICNLSFVDISAMVYAKENDCRLLTGDRKLKERALREGIKVSGILYITDMLASEGVISNEEMIGALERLLASNCRLPKSLIRERINRLRTLG